MEVRKQNHLLWTEFQTISKKLIKKIEAKTNYPFVCPVSRIQYIFSSKKGEISLVHFLKRYPSIYDWAFWEIYSLKGNLFSDVERYRTKKQAEKRIRKLL